MARVVLAVFVAVAAFGLLGTGGTIGVIDYFAGDLPSIDALQASKLTQTSRIFDRHGTLIEALYHQNRTVVPLSKISVTLQRATIDTEDRTFYANSGVDYRRLLIAIGYDLTHGSATLGGSTITQQVVKNNVLDTAEAQSKTISRKFRELVLAEEMERRYTKQQILELYLNTINYGNGAYGAEAAAETYFQVHASDLTWAQASFLAGLPQAPSDYDVFGTPDQVDAAKQRWRQVLDGMVAVGDISLSTSIDLFNSDLIDKMIAAHKRLPAAHNPLTAHFIDYVEQYISQQVRRPGACTRAAFGSRPRSTSARRSMASKWVKAGVHDLRGAGRQHRRDARDEPERRRDPGDDRERQLQQPRDPRPDQPDRRRSARLARRRIVVQGLHVRAALNAGLVTPATLLNDQNSVIGGHTFNDWDSKHEGYITLRKALAESRNLPALWTYRQEGGDRVVSFMHNLGRHGEDREPSGRVDHAGPRRDLDGAAPCRVLGFRQRRLQDHAARLC